MADLKHIAEELRRIAKSLEGLNDVLIDTNTFSEPEKSTERDTVSAPRVQMTWQKVAGAYARRYETARGMAWSPGAHVQALEDVAQFIDAQKGDGPTIGRTILDAFFDDPYAQKLGYPPTMLAKKAGDYLRPPSEDGKPDDQERRKRAQEAERRHQEAKARAEAKHAEEVRQRASGGTE